MEIRENLKHATMHKEKEAHIGMEISTGVFPIFMEIIFPWIFKAKKVMVLQ